jgi:hypothetical protein
MVHRTQRALFMLLLRAAVMVVWLSASWRTAAQEPGESPPLGIAPAVELGDLVGKRILEVEVVQAGRWRSDGAVRSVRVGEPMTAAAARRAARELLSTGGFADVVAYAEPLRDGAKLRLEAVPRRLIASRRVVGSALEASEVWQAAGLTEHDELTEAGLVQLAERVGAVHREWWWSQVHRW